MASAIKLMAGGKVLALPYSALDNRGRKKVLFGVSNLRPEDGDLTLGLAIPILLSLAEKVNPSWYGLITGRSFRFRLIR